MGYASVQGFFEGPKEGSLLHRYKFVGRRAKWEPDAAGAVSRLVSPMLPEMLPMATTEMGPDGLASRSARAIGWQSSRAMLWTEDEEPS